MRPQLAPHTQLERALSQGGQGLSPPLGVHHDGSGPVVIAPQHHPDGLAVQPVDIDRICGLAGPVQSMAVDVDAEVMRLLLRVLALVWSAHDSERLQDNTPGTISSNHFRLLKEEHRWHTEHGLPTRWSRDT